MQRATDRLKEVKDILDELNIIKTVLVGQSSVLTDTFACLTRLKKKKASSTGRSTENTNRTHEPVHLTDEDESVLELIDYYRAYGKLDTKIGEVDKLVHDAGRVQDNVGYTDMMNTRQLRS